MGVLFVLLARTLTALSPLVITAVAGHGRVGLLLRVREVLHSMMQGAGVVVGCRCCSLLGGLLTNTQAHAPSCWCWWWQRGVSSVLQKGSSGCEVCIGCVCAYICLRVQQERQLVSAACTPASNSAGLLFGRMGDITPHLALVACVPAAAWAKGRMCQAGFSVLSSLRSNTTPLSVCCSCCTHCAASTHTRQLQQQLLLSLLLLICRRLCYDKTQSHWLTVTTIVGCAGCQLWAACCRDCSNSCLMQLILDGL